MPKYNITVKTDGFRRAGRAWEGTTTIDSSDYEEAEFVALIKTLEEDPMFELVEVTDDINADEADTLLPALVSAIAQLDPANADHYTQGADAKPKVPALVKITGVKGITALQRDAAFELFTSK